MAAGDGLNKIWVKVWELIKSLTGEVNMEKGTLQKQINDLAENASSGIEFDTKEDYEAWAASEDYDPNVDAYYPDNGELVMAQNILRADGETSVEESLVELNTNLELKENVTYADIPQESNFSFIKLQVFKPPISPKAFRIVGSNIPMTTTNVKIGTVPEGFRASGELTCIVGVNNNIPVFATISVNSGGNLMIRASVAGTYNINHIGLMV